MVAAAVLPRAQPRAVARVVALVIALNAVAMAIGLAIAKAQRQRRGLRTQATALHRAASVAAADRISVL